MRKHRDIKLVTIETMNYLVSEPNLSTNLIQQIIFYRSINNRNENKKTKIIINKRLFRFNNVGISKTVTYEFWYGYVQNMKTE